MPAEGDAAGALVGARLRTIACILVAAVIWCVTQQWGLGETPVYRNAEAREAVVVWETTHRGGWIQPRRNGTDPADHPPLYHWLAAVTALLRGRTDEWSLRFPSTALSLLTALSVFAAASQLWNRRAGLLGTVVLLTSPGWLRASVSATVDVTQAAHLGLALLSLLFFARSRRPLWLLPFYAGTALAVLAEGPSAVVAVAAVAAGTAAVLTAPSLLRQLRPMAGLLAVACITALWYAPAFLAGGEEFLRQQTLPFFPSLRSSPAAGLRFAALAVDTLPWSIFLPAALAFRPHPPSDSGGNTAVRLLPVWIGTVLIIELWSGTHDDVPFLAAFPALAMLVGSWWDEQIRAPRTLTSLRRGVHALGIVFLICTAAVFAAALVTPALLPAPWLSSAAPQLHPAAAVVGDALGRRASLAGLTAGVLFIAVWGCLRACRTERWRLLFCCLAAASVAANVLAHRVVLAEVALHATPRAVVAALRNAVDPGAAVFFHRTFDAGILFYAGEHMPVYEGELSKRAPRHLLLEEERWKELERGGAFAFERVPLPIGPAPRLPPHYVLVRRVDP